MIFVSIYPRPTGAVNQEPRLVHGPRQGSGGRRQARWSHSPHCGEALGAMTGNGASSRGTRCSWLWQERWGGRACSHAPQLSWASSFSPLVQRQPIWQAYDIGYVHSLAHLHLLYFITALEHKNLWHLLTKNRCWTYTQNMNHKSAVQLIPAVKEIILWTVSAPLLAGGMTKAHLPDIMF